MIYPARPGPPGARWISLPKRTEGAAQTSGPRETRIEVGLEQREDGYGRTHLPRGSAVVGGGTLARDDSACGQGISSRLRACSAGRINARKTGRSGTCGGWKEAVQAPKWCAAVSTLAHWVGVERFGGGEGTSGLRGVNFGCLVVLVGAAIAHVDARVVTARGAEVTTPAVVVSCAWQEVSGSAGAVSIRRALRCARGRDVNIERAAGREESLLEGF